MAGGMGAAVVLREQLDVLVLLTTIRFVLDAVVGEVDLPGTAGRGRAPIAISSSSRSGRPSLSAVAVVLLQELLGTPSSPAGRRADLEPVALVEEPGFLLPVRRVEVLVVFDLPLTAHAGVERL
jgi:hypothetical protein